MEKKKNEVTTKQAVICAVETYTEELSRLKNILKGLNNLQNEITKYKAVCFDNKEIYESTHMREAQDVLTKNIQTTQKNMARVEGLILLLKAVLYDIKCTESKGFTNPEGKIFLPDEVRSILW